MPEAPVSALDVARYVLRNVGPVTTTKLQKLVYYAQAWSLAWDGRPLFPDPIEAWKHGPVVRVLYRRHRGQFWIHHVDAGSDTALDALQRETVDGVLERYGSLTPEVLSELTHAEDPWRDARQQGGRAPVIGKDAMRAYYRTVLADVQAQDPDGKLFGLKGLLSQIDPTTRHDDWDTGVPQGREVW